MFLATLIGSVIFLAWDYLNDYVTEEVQKARIEEQEDCQDRIAVKEADAYEVGFDKCLQKMDAKIQRANAEGYEQGFQEAEALCQSILKEKEHTFRSMETILMDSIASLLSFNQQIREETVLLREALQIASRVNQNLHEKLEVINLSKLTSAPAEDHAVYADAGLTAVVSRTQEMFFLIACGTVLLFFTIIRFLAAR